MIQIVFWLRTIGTKTEAPYAERDRGRANEARSKCHRSDNVGTVGTKGNKSKVNAVHVRMEAPISSG